MPVALMIAVLAVMHDPAAIAQDTLPAANPRMSFDSFNGDDAAVLVDDGPREDWPGMPVGPHAFDAGQIGAGTVDASDASPFDFAAVDAAAYEPFGGQCHGHCHDASGHALGPCGHRHCRDCGQAALWAVQVDGLVLWRNALGSQPLLEGTDGMVALNAGDALTAAAAGPRIGLVRSLGCGRAIEGNYFNVGGIQGSTATNGESAPYTPIGLADLAFTDIENAEYTTRGQIKSAELNYRWCQGRRLIWLAGFRWVEWNEVASVVMVPSGDDITTRVGNDLYGGQVGCRVRLWDLGKWQVGAVGKAGVFGNVAYQRTTAIVDGVGFGPIGTGIDDVAFFGEAGVNSTLWLTRWLGWRAGYNFFWLEGAATAARQMPLGNFGTSTASINTNGSVFLQGFSTGLEARW